MLTALVIIMVTSSFLMGRLSVFPQNKKLTKLKSELASMTASRDNWRSKYLVHVMRAKVKELHEKNGYPAED